MPVINQSSYVPPPLFSNAHLNTIYSPLFRKVKNLKFDRQRITTPDDDFFDVDWARTEHKQLAILCHGLEGSADTSYIKGMSRALLQSGWDTAAMNYRGCSGEPNKLLKAYHSGFTEDLDHLIQNIITNHDYERIVLVGFSLGGNLILKYLGEQGNGLPSPIHAAVAISVPCNLEAGSRQLSLPSNLIYMKRFMRRLKSKVRDKIEVGFDIDYEPFTKVHDFQGFDELFTAPVHGFESAVDYWRKCSSLHFIKDISIPTLIVNALDDPFLAPECYPFDQCKEKSNVFLETPTYGGHVGFTQFGSGGLHWSEQRTLEFFLNQ